MPDSSARLDLPYIQPAQAQKHVTHNEALLRLDGLVQLSVLAFDAETPPSVPMIGDIYALGAAPTGEWAGHPDQLAIRDETAWRFVAPQEGWRAWGAGVFKVFTAGAWAILPNLQNLEGLGVGTSSDAANPLAVSGPATLLTHDGNGHQVKVNKATSGETASLLFQTDWTSHAEIGLAGDNDLHVKVSSDGSSWTEALVVEGATGQLSGAAVQSDPDDATAGRLVKMGDHAGPFGLGSSRTSPVSGSLDDLQNGGVTRFMSWASGATQVPWNDGLGLQIMDWETTGNQLAFSRGANPSMAFRATTSSTPTFSEWCELFHTGNMIGTVSATPGVGSALIERGSNANGEYVRFADGTQICHHNLLLDAPSTAVGGGFQGATATAWSFPAAFAAGTTPGLSGSDTNVGGVWLSIYCPGAALATLRAMRFTSASAAPQVQVTAIGVWK